MNTPPSTEMTRQRLALQLLGAQVSVEDATHAADLLEPQLDPPCALGHIVPPRQSGPLPSVLEPPIQAVFQEMPTALFDECPDLSVADVPREWIPLFVCWGARYQRWQNFCQCKALLKEQSADGMPPLRELPVTDAVVAGLLLLLHTPPPDSPLRQQLMPSALSLPFGAYLAAEAHHTDGERPAILESLARNNRLLHWASRLPQFGSQTIRLAKRHFDLWSGLTLIRHAGQSDLVSAWLHELAQRACHMPSAAVAALVLQPAAPSAQQQLWRATLSQPAAGRWVFEAVWWARHTWPPEAWTGLKDHLRPYATADSQWWFHWALLEPEWVAADYERTTVDPLWAVELLHARRTMRLRANDQPLRNQMVERLIQNHGDPIASIVLRHLNYIQDGGGAAP